MSEWKESDEWKISLQGHSKGKVVCGFVNFHKE